jgi:drug/metabolite transporter (DMT)-like permease
MTKNNKKGMFYIILSGISFMIVNFFVKLLGNPNFSFLSLPTYSKFPPHEIVLFRSIISFTISAYLLKRKKLSIFGNNKKWLIIRGSSGMIALTIFFYTIHHLPLAIASTLQYLAPIFTLLISIPILKEKTKPLQWFFVFTALLGVLIIGYSNSQNITINKEIIQWKWVILGIVSAMFSGLAYVSVVKLKATETPLNIVIYFPMISLPFLFLWSLFDFVIPKGMEWIYLLLLGVFTQIAQVSMTKGFMYGDISVISPFQYLGSIYAIIIGTFLFDENLEFITYVGILLILISVILNIVVKNTNQKHGTT